MQVFFGPYTIRKMIKLLLTCFLIAFLLTVLVLSFFTTISLGEMTCNFDRASIGGDG